MSTPQRSRGAGREPAPEAEYPLGDFLRAHRARLTPEEAGISSYGVRRVPGLRREELARLAGVSANYYTRLEQGEATNPSASVIDALARALRLDADATVYLRGIVGTTAPGTASAVSAASEDGMALTFDRIVDLMPTTAALTLSQTNDVLSHTPVAHELFFAHLPPRDEPWNTHRLLFTDPHTRDLYRDWAREAALAVASLRFHAAAHPGDPAVRALVGELSVTSGEFATLWAEHPVRRCTRGVKHLTHPEFGDLDLEYQMLHAPDGDGRRILIHSAPPGTPTADALALLAG
ncbi:XRE family transcriptional regulator [Streptomyces sp. AJS327]|uniref:helix-turn-helix domain-containing protein n=1 Tax=Streptomyces sp. AJS327 TaxID=2545265 RepID=UPI0015DE98F6|nr:helix-turn-helix transcriptional regulator [Streptomyces sp. AJS327]MBA0053604.1 XRE family transcriptional regulator [Streptomyces sp. AJS327]